MPPTATFELLYSLLRSSHFHQVLGLKLVDAAAATDDSVSIRMPFSALLEREPDTGQFHGGPIASLIDVAGDFALIRALGHGVPTIALNVEYLRPASGACLIAKATVRKAGRTVGFVDVDVKDPNDRLVALGRGCYGTQPG